jgi:ubiquinone/menaquinone biosynthesis C-methylase UbiE
MDPKEKFSLKSESYDKYRPEYSPRVIDYIKKHYSVNSKTRVADIGAGTGILTKQLLGLDCQIYGVEPNSEMRSIAQRKLKDEKNCQILNGSAENTLLKEKSIDLVVVGQAFHWFKVKEFKKELQRISKTGKVILLWNIKLPTQPYLLALEKINRTYCKDFLGFSGGIKEEEIGAFFDGVYKKVEFENNLSMDKNSFVQGIFTASYAPHKNDVHYEDYLSKIEGLFDQYSERGTLNILNNSVSFLN